ncbi:MAG: bifunctional nuclease domain-containing protein [Sphingobacteriaceae bacterium]
MEKVRLDIVGLSYSQTQTGSCALVLGEVNGRRRLPIVIGGFEAQAIAIELEKMTPARPLTHDLFKTFAECYGIRLQEVIIYNLVGSIFYAKLICFDGKKTTEIDARTSDAVALAVRFECPIFTYEFILASAGTLTEGNESTYLEDLSTDIHNTLVQPTGINYTKVSTEELQKKLQEALAQEAYEKAANIRDELERRKLS